MKSIHTEIVINARPNEVWKVLMDFENYPRWNPFITSISGQAEKDGKLKAVLNQADSKPMTFKPTCLVAEENKEFRWLGHLFVPGLFDGEHIFKMKEVEGGKTKFVQCENFKGILVPVFWKTLNTKTIKAFEMMNQSLKKEVESLSST